MRQRLRSHLTYANVISTLSLFLVLGGGTALAAYVVSSNSQIGPNTVSGHAGGDRSSACLLAIGHRATTCSRASAGTITAKK
jgi:hypothetical protein